MKRNFLTAAAVLTLAYTLASVPSSLASVPSSGVEGQCSGQSWTFSYDSLGIRGLFSASDPYGADLVSGELLGDVLLTYKVRDGLWQTLKNSGRKASFGCDRVIYTDEGIGGAMELRQSFSLEGECVRWEIKVANNSRYPVEIGDLAVCIPWKNDGGEDPDEIFERSFIKHAFVSGDASFFYFTRYNGEAPYIMLLPDKGTPLEYYDNLNRGRYYAFIRSSRTGGGNTAGTWRQAHSSDTLAPGDSRTYGFTFLTADSYAQMRDMLYEYGSVDTKVVPGMTVPRGTEALFSLRCRGGIDSIGAEFPDETVLRHIRSEGDTHIYAVNFARLGENMLTVNFDGGRRTYLEFFSCLPAKELMLKRSAFLTERQQFRDTGRWYDGLYGEYDMVAGELRGPDNPDFYDEKLTYFLASDDPILGKAPFIASKNAVWPDAREIESLEYHISRFVWGGLQRTGDEHPYEYGVYGTPNWYINRHQDLRLTQTDYKTETMRVWRTYDYPHVIMLWWEMYKIARDYPSLSRLATADEYLDRAYHTARVYFIYPDALLGDYYETFKWGAYNELVIPEIIDELQAVGRTAEADTLRRNWEKKVDYFLHGDKYPYRSEYAADRTAFESTYALVKYADRHGIDPAATAAFMDRQNLANLACRGVLENQWFLLGSDFFNSSDWSLLTYMTRMGGSSLLDYGIRYAAEPYDWIRLGYSSCLAQYGMMNAGDEESGYGFWQPGREKDGALGMSYMPLKSGQAWIGTLEARGPWRYCGEGDLGMCAVTRSAATIFVTDPLFGPFVYGGSLETGDDYGIIPENETLTRFFAVTDKVRFGLEVRGGHFAEGVEMALDKGMKRLDFVTEATVLPDGSPAEIPTELLVEKIAGLSGTPALYVDGRRVRPVRDPDGRLRFPLSAGHPVSLRF